MKKHERIHSEEHQHHQPLTPPRPDMSPNPTVISQASSLKVPISPPHSTVYSEGSYYSMTRNVYTHTDLLDGWIQPSLNHTLSPASDYHDSFHSSSSQSVKQEPSTPYSPPSFLPDDIMNQLMFVDDNPTQLKTEYNTGN